MQRRIRVSTAMLSAALVSAGLLAPGPTTPVHLAAPASPDPAGAQPLVDAGNCHGPRRELRFAWLKPGEEPTLPAGPASVCLAVYEVR
jgi:hypothetical protein